MLQIQTNVSSPAKSAPLARSIFSNTLLTSSSSHQHASGGGRLFDASTVEWKTYQPANQRTKITKIPLGAMDICSLLQLPIEDSFASTFQVKGIGQSCRQESSESLRMRLDVNFLIHIQELFVKVSALRSSGTLSCRENLFQAMS